LGACVYQVAAVKQPSADLYTALVAKTRQQRRLLTVHWELTYRCNARCAHCYLDVLPPDASAPGELTTVECQRVLDEMAALGILNLTLSGGEILVRPDFFEIAGYARRQQFLLRLFTNGTLITPAVADRIAALHPFAVEVSLYSVNPATHDRITRRERSWALTTRAFRLLRERNVRTVMKTPLMRENVQEIDALELLAKELGAQFRYDPTITPKDSGESSPLEHRLPYRDVLWLLRKRFDPAIWMEREVRDDQATCNIANNAIVVDPYGNVFPCVQVRLNAGNLREKSLREIWASSPVWQTLRRMSLCALPVCRACALRAWCVRCHGLAHIENGDLYGPALANCREALARRQVLVERGNLSADYPIPAHLQAYASTLELEE